MTTASTETTQETPRERSPTVSVILPAYNEEEALPSVLEETERLLDSTYEVIVVDDGSSDHTREIADASGCRVVAHGHNRGKGAAIRTGLEAANGDYIVVMDADASYPVAAIPDVVAKLGDYDIVRGRRRLDPDNTPWINRVGNTAFNRVLSALHGLDSGDHLSGLYGMHRDVLSALDTEAPGFDIEVEIGIKSKARGLTVADVPIAYRPRLGDKKLHPVRDGARILGRILRLVLLYRPLLLFGIPGAVLLVLSVVGAIALSRGPVVTPYLGLSIHTFIVATLGVLTGFQLLVFGVAASLYKVRLGFAAPRLLWKLTSPAARTTAAAVGTLLFLVGAVALAVMIVGWIAAGGPAFTNTRGLVLAATALVLGLQLMSAAFFIAIFRDRSAAPVR